MQLLNYLFAYYGIDWFGTLFVVLGIYFLGEKQKKGFIFGVIGSSAWLIFAVMVDSVASFVLNVLMIGLNIRGYLKWIKEDTPPVSTQNS